MDDVIAAYQGVSIVLQPREIKGGGWMADFTLIEERGSETDAPPYYGKNAYSTREDAKRAGLDSARRIIDETWSRAQPSS